MLRTLAHYWRVNLAVALGAAVATAVLAGALVVGDSVRGSLRDLTLDRLGRIDRALAGERFFREALADDLAAAGLPGSVPAVVLRGSATRPDSGARASGVAIAGIDERFAALYDAQEALALEPSDGALFPPVVLNAALARELGAVAGDAVLLSFGRLGEVPRDTLMGETGPDDVLGRIRLSVTRVIPDRGPGRFGLVPTQQVPLNAFVELSRIQRALERRGRVNALFVPTGAPADAQAILDRTRTLDDLGLTLTPGDGYVTVGSREFVLAPKTDAAIAALAAESAAPMMRTQSYLANAIELGERSVPYSLVAALDPRPEWPWARLTLRDGRPAPVPGPGQVLLDTWAADDLGAAVGDTVTLRYFEVGVDEGLTETAQPFEVAGVVRMEGLGADRRLTPDYPGIREARDIAAWDPPFPVDLKQVRDKDERFWDDHGPTPKAFVSEATGRELWSTRFGSTTAVRLGLEAADLEQKLLAKAADAGLALDLRPVREEGLRASAGATDFSMLFVSFSFFIIISAALLVGLLFRLGVEQRSREIGLLLALGYRVRKVRRRLLGEGLVLAAAGGVVGLALGLGYAWAMIAGLRTLWRPAVGSSELYLHVSAASLPAGWAISVVVVLATVALAVRKLVRLAPQRLLAGELTEPGPVRPGRIVRLLAYGGLIAGVALLVYALVSGKSADPGLAFGSGAALLVSGLGFFTRWLRRPGQHALASGHAGLASMAARSSAWNPSRSVLSAALVASACFVLVMVAASAGASHDLEGRESGSGGYALVAESDIPLYQSLDDPDDLLELGFPRDAVDELAPVAVTALRALPGDDASCLNLYRPERPRILGVGPDFVARGAFTFQQHQELPEGEDNPWLLLEQPLEPGVVPAVADFNSAMWILHLGLGGELTIQDERGSPLRLRLVGLLARSVLQSEVLISEAAFLEHFPGRGGDSFFLIDAPADRVARVSELLESDLAPFGFDATTTRDRLLGFHAVESTYIATFQALGALGLLLGTVGLGVVLLRNVVERRGELATLRAFGFRRARLAWLVLLENAFLLCIGVGVGSVAALVAVAPSLATQPLPWASLGWTLAGVWAVGMLSSVLAVRGTLHTPLLPALKSER